MARNWEILKHTTTAEVAVFETEKDFLDFIEDRILSAEYEIDVTHFNPVSPGKRWNEIIQRGLEKESLKYRRVVMLHERGSLLKHIQRFFEEYKKKLKDLTFQVRYFCAPQESHEIPLFNFLIIDAKEVAMGGYYLKATEESPAIWTCDESIVRIIKVYFDFLWNHSHDLNEEKVEELLNRSMQRK